MKNINQTGKKVSIIIVNFNGLKFLDNLFKSISTQTYRNYEVLFVDNGSQDTSVRYVENTIMKKYPAMSVRIIKLTKNTGFTCANNLGAHEASGEFLLFLNNDTSLEKDALAQMVQKLEEKFMTAGVSPKIYLSKFLPVKIFDSIGTCMDPSGSPYNRGIGQIDLGQYDIEEEIFGVCFACALVRRDIFLFVGGLDNSYFAYFEDVDWSFRARKLGFRFVSAPKSVVYHLHSGTTSMHQYAWKYNLIFRNFLRTIVKDFGKKNAIKLSMQRLKGFIHALFSKRTDPSLKSAILKVIVNFIFVDWYVYTLRRLRTRDGFIKNLPDAELFAFSSNEPSIFFDPQKYTPLINLELLKFIAFRKYKHTQNSKADAVWNELEESFYCSRNNTEWKARLAGFLSSHFPTYSNQKTLDFIYNHFNSLVYKKNE